MAPDLFLDFTVFVLASTVVIGLLTVVTLASAKYASRKYGISVNECLVGE